MVRARTVASGKAMVPEAITLRLDKRGRQWGEEQGFLIVERGCENRDWNAGVDTDADDSATGRQIDQAVEGTTFLDDGD